MLSLLLIAFIMLGAALIAVPIAARWGLGSVLGYLLAGIIISPLLSLLGVDVISIQHVSEFGIILLLFLIGLELSPKQFWARRTQIFGLGSVQLICTTLIVSFVAKFIGFAWATSLAVGMVLSLSSTAIVAQLLKEKSLLVTDGGQRSVSVLLFQDMAVVPILALLPLLVAPELIELSEAGATTRSVHEDEYPFSVTDRLPAWAKVLFSLSSIGIILLVGTYLIRPIFNAIGSARVRELYMVAALFLIVGTSLLMLLVGLPPPLGAFVAGVILANNEYRHEFESVIDPFRGLLIGAYFMTFGAAINFSLFFEYLAVIVGLTLGLILLKMAVLICIASVIKLEPVDKWLFSLSLAPAGEFGLVLLSFAVASTVIPAREADLLILVVVMSMMITPLLLILLQYLSGRAVGSNAQNWQGGLTVFLSYSRNDTQSMLEIAELLESRGFKVIYDSRDLPFGEKWKNELRYLIEQSDVVLWLVSQSSVDSYWCQWELGKVTALRKKLTPVAVSQFSMEDLPDEIQEIQILPLNAIFNIKKRTHVKNIIDVLGTDVSWIKLYTRLSDRARAWDNDGRNSNRLLPATELEEAEQWQSSKPPLAPEPMSLVLDFIHSSRINQEKNGFTPKLLPD